MRPLLHRLTRHRLVLCSLLAGLVLTGLPAGTTVAAAASRVAAAEAPTVTLEVSRTSVKVGGSFTLRGTAAGAEAGATVTLQRGSRGTWATIGTATTNGAGAFSLPKVAATAPGAFLFRALVDDADAPVSSEFRWLVVTERKAPTVVSGYVLSGGPIAGSTVKIRVPGRSKPVRTTTTTYGYFLAELPSLPKRMRIEATGGVGPIGRLKGTLVVEESRPTTEDSIHVNPVTTLVAAYSDRHPKATPARADAKVRRGLGLEAFHALGSALRGRPDYFDGVEFLRTAKRNGGLDAYVAQVIRRIERGGGVDVSGPAAKVDQGGAIVGLIGAEAAGYLGVASQTASVISGSIALMGVIGSVFGWSPGGDPNADVLDAIAQIDKTLTGIETQINQLQASLDADFDALALKVDDATYAAAVKSLGDAYNAITIAQAKYEDYIYNQDVIAACVQPPPPGGSDPIIPKTPCTLADPDDATTTITLPSTTVSTAVGLEPKKLDAYRSAAEALESYLGIAQDTFHDALLLSDATGAKPALNALVNLYLDKTDQVFLPDGTDLVKTFVTKVLSNQAWAYYLVVAYEKSLVLPGTPGPANGTLAKISTGYLGSTWSTWTPATPGPNGLPVTPTTAPPAGRLHDEIEYLQGILPMPAGMALDANTNGLMYLTSDAVPLEDYVPTDATSRASCGGVLDYNTGYRDYPQGVRGGNAPGLDSQVCYPLADAIKALNTDTYQWVDDQAAAHVTTATAGLPATAYWPHLSTGWESVAKTDLQTVIGRLYDVHYGSYSYFDWGPVDFPIRNGYYVDSDFNVCADQNPPDPNTGYGPCNDGTSKHIWMNSVIDSATLYYRVHDGTTGTCTWSLGQSVSVGPACQTVYPMLLGRSLGATEKYVPLQ